MQSLNQSKKCIYKVVRFFKIKLQSMKRLGVQAPIKYHLHIVPELKRLFSVANA